MQKLLTWLAVSLLLPGGHFSCTKGNNLNDLADNDTSDNKSSSIQILLDCERSSGNGASRSKSSSLQILLDCESSNRNDTKVEPKFKKKHIKRLQFNKECSHEQKVKRKYTQRTRLEKSSKIKQKINEIFLEKSQFVNDVKQVIFDVDNYVLSDDFQDKKDFILSEKLKIPFAITGRKIVYNFTIYSQNLDNIIWLLYAGKIAALYTSQKKADKVFKEQICGIIRLTKSLEESVRPYEYLFLNLKYPYIIKFSSNMTMFFVLSMVIYQRKYGNDCTLMLLVPVFENAVRTLCKFLSKDWKFLIDNICADLGVKFDPRFHHISNDFLLDNSVIQLIYHGMKSKSGCEEFFVKIWETVMIKKYKDSDKSF